MADEWSERDVSEILHNPVYAGVGPFPAIVSEAEWIKAAVILVESEGTAEFLRRMLASLRASTADLVLAPGSPEARTSELLGLRCDLCHGPATPDTSLQMHTDQRTAVVCPACTLLLAQVYRAIQERGVR